MNRLKRLMSSLISNNQSSFVPGRHVVDNIVVYQEVVRSTSQRKGRKGLMAIKVDLEKANDRLQWGFILETLNLAGIPNYLTELIIYEMCRNCFS